VQAQDETDAADATLTGEIVIKTVSGKKNAIFNSNGTVTYKVKVSNLYKIAQEGDFSYLVRTDMGVKVYEKREKFSISKTSSKP